MISSKRLIGVFVLGFCLAAVRTVVAGDPVPRIHDEFSYLLNADTFRHGRLTNPPNASPEFFDTYHELQRPTYASKYQPGQGLAIAVGWVFGRPIVGVWLGFAAMSAAFYWMLAAWLDERWTLAATVGAVGWLSLTYWANTYWGGALAAFGGALVYGAAARLWNRPSRWPAVAFTAGLFVLANTRPLEGLLAAVPPSILLLVRMIHPRYRRPDDRWSTAVLPMLAIGVAGAAFTLYYDARVTGDPLTLPYVAYERTEESAPLFIWQHAEVRTFEDAGRMAFQDWGLDKYNEFRAHYLRELASRVASAITFFIPVYLLIPFALLPRTKLTPVLWTGLAGVGLVLTELSVTTWFGRHYLAPVAAPLFGTYFVCWEEMRRVSGPLTRSFSRLAVGLMICWLVVPPLALVVAAARGDAAGEPDWGNARQRLSDSLAVHGGRHLLFVHYPPGYNPHQEWVFNGADIPTQNVIWAHDLGSERDQQLLARYPGSEALIVSVSMDSPFYHLSPIH